MLGNTDSIHEILVIVQNSDDPLPLLWTKKLIKMISHILIHGHISAKIIWIFPFETQIGLVECATNKTFIKTSLANRLDEIPKQTNSKSQPSFVGMAIICLTIWVCIWYSIISCSGSFLLIAVDDWNSLFRSWGQWYKRMSWQVGRIWLSDGLL